MTEELSASTINRMRQEVIDICEIDNGKPVIPILVDCDGTLVDHQYPKMGDENEHCIEIMKRWTQRYNVGWILWTMRDGEYLEEAVKWLKDRGIKLYGINRNPTQDSWAAGSHKAYGYMCIDDINCCTPLIYEEGKRPRVDWLKLAQNTEPMLKLLTKDPYEDIYGVSKVSHYKTYKQ